MSRDNAVAWIPSLLALAWAAAFFGGYLYLEPKARPLKPAAEYEQLLEAWRTGAKPIPAAPKVVEHLEGLVETNLLQQESTYLVVQLLRTPILALASVGLFALPPVQAQLRRGKGQRAA